MKPLVAIVAVLGTLTGAARLSAAELWLSLPGGDGPGNGKHVVLVSGDEEYRSEETLTQLAKILSTHHGFKCTVLYAIDPKTGTINPNVNDNIPGLEHLKSADLMILFTRFRNLPDDQLRHIVDYVESGKPIVGLRTSTHAFSLKNSKYPHYHWQSKAPGWEGGFGRTVLGETWVNHHGKHGTEGTRGVIAPGLETHPIVKGIAEGSIFGTSDVYEVKLPLPGDSTPIVLGQVTETLAPDSKPVGEQMKKGKVFKPNDPMMPVAWTKTYTTQDGKKARVFTTTMGASQDFAHEGTRRMLVNGCYWALGLEDKIPEKSKVDVVGTFEPRPFKNNGFAPGVKPADLK